MKSINLHYLIIFFTSILLFSCSSSNDDNVADGNNDPTSITITSDKTSIGVGETIVFTVTTNTGIDVTSQSTIKVNNSSISGNTYTPTTAGDFSVQATYQSLTSNALSVNAAEITSLDISSDFNSVTVAKPLTFSVTANYSNGTSADKTGESQFFVDNTSITGNIFYPLQAGTISVYATLSSVTSNTITIQVSDPSYTKKAIIEDYTGTWCGWCPRISYASGLVEQQTHKVLTIGVHIGTNSEPDSMENGFGLDLRSAFGVTSYPTAYIDRSDEWNYPEPDNTDQAVDAAQGNTNVGLDVNSTLSGTVMDITIKTGFDDGTLANGDAKLVVFVLENEIVDAQKNYTSYYQGGQWTYNGQYVSNFIHNGVLRYSATDVMGDATTSTQGEHQYTFNVDLANHNVADAQKTTVVAMLVDSAGTTVLNAQWAAAGTHQPFD